ncbi:MAG: hypothetical protein OEQ49_01190 [Myxococcales bacterium]|nr:hypothetical protein [Myxococcales bacterium]
MGRVLEEGDNCWRVARAGRAAFIVDGESYFRAVREAVRSARRSIFSVGWDIHSELELIRNGGSDDELPTALGPLLDAVAHERPELDIYILSWDFAMIYAMEREFFPQYKLRWKSHDRVRFCLDGEHPLGASQHQKIVVVDDCLGFCGGLDLSQWRWDTCEHRVEDERRKDPKGKSPSTSISSGTQRMILGRRASLPSSSKWTSGLPACSLTTGAGTKCARSRGSRTAGRRTRRSSEERGSGSRPRSDSHGSRRQNDSLKRQSARERRKPRQRVGTSPDSELAPMQRRAQRATCVLRRLDSQRDPP